MQLGQMIVKIRKEQGLTQETFAKKFNVTRQTVSNWENEKSYPDLHTLIKISDVFDISLDSLMKGDATMVQSIDKKVKKHLIFKGIIVGLTFIIIGLIVFIYFSNKSLNNTAKEYMDYYVKGVENVEIYDFNSDELVVKYDDRQSLDKFISALDIDSWEKAENKVNVPAEYIIKLYFGESGDDNIREITIYKQGEYATIFTTSPGGVKQNYKTDIDVSKLLSK